MTKQPHRSLNVIYRSSEFYIKCLANLAWQSELSPGASYGTLDYCAECLFADCMRPDGNSEL